MGTWLSWLERLVDVEKVRGSSPLVPTEGDGEITVAFLFPLAPIIYFRDIRNIPSNANYFTGCAIYVPLIWVNILP